MTVQGIELFIEALRGSGAELHVEDILDALWLANQPRRLSLHAVIPSARQSDVAVPPLFVEDRVAGRYRETPPSKRMLPGDVEVPSTHDETAPVYAPGGTGPKDRTVKASPVALPAGHALSGRLLLTRALRPFRQRWPSRHEEVLDEQRTAEATAELRGYLYPVFRPLQERWFDVDVVLEDDPTIVLWNDTLRDFCQMLRDTGAFRDVRSWRLRMPADVAPTDGKQSPFLETPTGGRVSTRALAGCGVRRLIFFVTHGSSTHWLDGSYARLFSHWMHGASLVILHLFDRNHWKRGALGEPHGLCSAHEPGATTANLHIEPFWWILAGDELGDLLPVPAVPLAASAFGEWAHMQMARGRRCPVFLLDPRQSFIETAGPLNEQDRVKQFERAVALLREASDDAFRLAVYLSAGAFTIPVARLVQEAKFGAAAQQSHLAEVLLSGLVFARSPQQAATDPNELYYEFHADARAILMRSLRGADAEFIALVLERRLSQYIEQIYGRSITFRALVPDENGNYELPEWAQPFAHLGLSLLGTSVRGKSATQLLKEFRESNPPALVASAARLAASTPLGGPLHPRSLDPNLWRALLAARLVNQDSTDQWRFLAGIEPLLAGIASQSPLLGAEVLWVDDNPANNKIEASQLIGLGATIETALSTEDALYAIAVKSYDVIISDMKRGAKRTAGFDLMGVLHARAITMPLIIYSSSIARGADAIQFGAFGQTSDPRELLDLVRNAFKLSVRVQTFSTRESSVLQVLWSIGIGIPRSVELLTGTPYRMGLEILATQSNAQVAFRNHLKVIQAYAASGVNHLILVEDIVLRVIAAVLKPDKTGSNYEKADWEGVIGRAVRHGSAVWVPDVSRDPEYIRAESSTRAELALPLLSQRDSSVVGVVNIEMDEADTLTETNIEWLKRFCAPLAGRIPSANPMTFLSFAKADESFAARLSRDLRIEGGIDAHAPLSWPDRRLNVADFVIALISQSSVNASGEYTELPLNNVGAMSRIVPVIIGDIDNFSGLNNVVASTQMVDFRKGYQSGLRQLLRAVGRAEPGAESSQKNATAAQTRIEFRSEVNSSETAAIAYLDSPDRKKLAIELALRYAGESGTDQLKAALARHSTDPSSDVTVSTSRGPAMLSVSEGNLSDFEADRSLNSYEASNHVFADVFGLVSLRWPILFFLSESNPSGVSSDLSGDIVSIIYLGRPYSLADVTAAIDGVLVAQGIRLVRSWFLRFLRKEGVDPERISTLKNFVALPEEVSLFLRDNIDALRDVSNESHTLVTYNENIHLYKYLDLQAVAESLGFTGTNYGILRADARKSFQLQHGDTSDSDFAEPRQLGERLQEKGLQFVLGNLSTSLGLWMQLPEKSFASMPVAILFVEERDSEEAYKSPAFANFRRLKMNARMRPFIEQ